MQFTRDKLLLNEFSYAAISTLDKQTIYMLIYKVVVTDKMSHYLARRG